MTTTAKTGDETYKAIVEIGTQTVRYAFLVNAGAILALLTFLGQVWGIPRPPPVVEAALQAGNLKLVFGLYIAGVVFAMAANLLGYLGQLALFREQTSASSRQHLYIKAAVAFVVVSVLLFCLASFLAGSFLVDSTAGIWDEGIWDNGVWDEGVWRQE